MSIPRHLLVKAAAVTAMGALLPFTNPAKASAARLCTDMYCFSSCQEIPPGMCDPCFRPVACVQTGLMECPFLVYCDSETK